MIKYLFSLTVNLCIFTLAFSQSYWQQTIDYKIQAELFPGEKTLRGEVDLSYTNNSPNSLDSIVFHVWPNAYVSGETPLGKQVVQQKGRDWHFADKEDRGYIDSLSFISKGRVLNFDSLDAWGEILVLRLPESLSPGGVLDLKIPFKLKVPKFISRMGHENGEFHFCHWYPKPAVYDKNDWNAFPYLDQGEFYSDYGSFSVKLTVPSNYTVAASGSLLTFEERNRLIQLESDCEIEVIAGKKTIEYEISPAFDFAWFASPRYCLKSDKVKLTENAFFTEVELYHTENMEAESRTALKNAMRALIFLSEEVGSYPYKSFKVVLSQISTGGGMEYPGIVLIDEFKDPKALDLVIAHEAGHQWFMGMLGSNERKNAWMDEGVNSFYEHKYTEKFYSGSEDSPIQKMMGLNTVDLSYIQYAFLAHQGNDQPIGLPADSMSYINYGLGVYQKGALNFHYLEEYLGKEQFQLSMKKYFNQFRFKHPHPEDLRTILENDCKCKMDWLFDGLTNSNGLLDYKLSKIKRTENGTALTIKNKGDINGPVFLSLYNKEGTKLDSSIIEGFKGEKIINSKLKDVSVARIDPQHQMPEYNRSNNRINQNALFTKFEKPKLKVLGSFDSEEFSELYLLPLLAANQIDGFMLGLGVYNTSFLAKNFEWGFFPMYGTKTKEFVGQGFVRGHINPRIGWVHKMSIGLDAKNYNYFKSPKNVFMDHMLRTEGHIISKFTQLNPELRIRIRPKSYVSRNEQEIVFSSPIIKNEFSVFDINSDGNAYYVGNEKFWYSFQRINWSFKKNRKINAWGAKAGLEYAGKSEFPPDRIPGNYLKAQAEFSFNIDFPSQKDRLNIRFFAGSFLMKDHESFRANAGDFRMLSFHGEDDYSYSNLYPGRTARDDFWAKQIYVKDGGMKLSIPENGANVPGRNNQWLTAMNLSLDVPGKIPFRLFTDMAYYPDTQFGNQQSATIFAYSGGVSLPLFGDYAEIYFPFFFSDDLELQLTGKKWYENIRFRIDFDRINPFELVRNISL